MKTLNHIIPAVLLWASAGSSLPIPGTERYIELPTVLPGKILKISKELDLQSGRIHLVSNLPEVTNVASLLSYQAAQAAADRALHGNLYPALAKKVSDLGHLDHIMVVVQLKTQNHMPLDKTRHDVEELIRDAQVMANLDPVVLPLVVLTRYGLVPLEFRGNSMAMVKANKIQLEALKSDGDVSSVWEELEESNLAPELTTLGSSGYNPGPVPSGIGSGVKVATYEHGLTSSFLSCIGVTPAEYDAFTQMGEDENKRHSQATFRTLVASSPSATFYHRYSVTFNSSGDVSYLTNRGVQSVSMSRTRGGSTPYRATYSEFLTMDGMAYTYPYPVYVLPAGNLGYSNEVNWQGYNMISVGNVRHTNDNNFQMADCTQTKNPPPRYGSCISGSGENCAGDREMPHIVAPGIPNSGTTFATSCLEGTGTLYCATSFSAPVANGMAANAIAADSRLKSWPEKVRATLVLTAQNVESGDWTVSGDERDGTGTVSGSEAVSFASSHTSVSPGNSACEKGMGAASFYSSDFSSNKRFNFLVPNPKPAGKHLRVVLTWDSNPNVNNGTNDLSDLDLVVQKNGSTATSSSWDSNVEVVDVAAADLAAGSSYYIDIVPYANRIPSGSYFYYAIAWGWVKDHAP